ncbi:MAG: histidinol dehydrogenase [Verrucomicrobia bacterium]|nr:histidinol dehydrogenase [Verrucomicrobiota bacterium]
MRRLDHRSPDFETRLAALEQTSLFDPAIEARTRDIIEAVRARGDDALIETTARFDGWQAAGAAAFRVTAEELRDAGNAVSADFKRAAKFALRNIEFFNRRGLRRGWSARNPQGAAVGEKYDPLRRVGIYVPGGTAPLVSSSLMTVALARVAGCLERVVCTPARNGKVNPALLFGLKLSGATEIYKLGGSQAVAAMAYGTATIGRVSKVFGPGNAYVVAAKRLLFGHVGVDLLPGPSELLVIADDSAEPPLIAADMLAQAEHGSGHERVFLVTTSEEVEAAVRAEIEKQLASLSRSDLCRKVLANTAAVIIVRSLAQAAEIANRIAPEHLELHCKGARKLLPKLTTAGAIFIGRWSPTVAGDFVAGPSHELPTGGAGRIFPGLTVDQFQRRTSIVEYSRESLRKSVAAIGEFAKAEGLDAHGKSATIRFER